MWMLSGISLLCVVGRLSVGRLMVILFRLLCMFF